MHDKDIAEAIFNDTDLLIKAVNRSLPSIVANYLTIESEEYMKKIK